MSENLQLLSTHYPWVPLIFFFYLGACLGSFFNVCIHRIPEGRSVVKPGSRCMCGAPIAWFDNFPVISWFLLRGKARCCGQPFTIRYPFIELLTGAFFLLSWWLFGHSNPAFALGVMILCGTLIPAVFIDLDHMVIPDVFSIGGAVIGVFFSLFFPALHGIDGSGIVAGFFGGMESVLGLLVGSATIYWIGALGEMALRKEAMGEGDVKFLGCIGAFCGWQGALCSIFGGAFVGTVLLLPILLYQKIRGPLNPEDKPATGDDGESIAFGMHVPFGPLLAVGALLYVFIAQEMIDSYFSGIWQTFHELAGH
ncbi:MAG: prepilin peptidase [Opitutae bacterium]|nr:prepilin peptidase [Opitutae bacterium]